MILVEKSRSGDNVGWSSHEDDDSGCPECGSQCLRRVEGPDARSDGVEDLDKAKSGYYVCERCMTEHYAEFKIEKPQLPVFEPTAQCPHCSSYNTIVRFAYSEGGTRTHKCRSCEKGFKTRMAIKQ